MMTVKTLTAHIATAHDGSFSVEASTMGFVPGEFPAYIPTTLGNGEPFELIRHRVVDGELLSVYYRQDGTAANLTVWND